MSYDRRLFASLQNILADRGDLKFESRALTVVNESIDSVVHHEQMTFRRTPEMRNRYVAFSADDVGGVL